jgi:hypothetical protein
VPLDKEMKNGAAAAPHAEFSGLSGKFPVYTDWAVLT